MSIKGKPLTDTLGEIEGGNFLAEVTEELYNVMAAVMEHRKQGTLTIALKISPTGKGTVTVDAKFDGKKPEETRPSTTFFVGKDLSLQRRDPNQPDLPLRAVETPDNRPVRVLGGGE